MFVYVMASVVAKTKTGSQGHPHPSEEFPQPLRNLDSSRIRMSGFSAEENFRTGLYEAKLKFSLE